MKLKDALPIPSSPLLPDLKLSPGDKAVPRDMKRESSVRKAGLVNTSALSSLQAGQQGHSAGHRAVSS